MRSRFLLVGFFLLSACSSNGSRLSIEVVTGLVPGPEFAYVVTETFPPGDDSEGLLRVQHVEATSRFRDQYLRGHRVASFEGIASGEQRVRVSLLRPDRTLLVSQEVSVLIATPIVQLRVRIDRGCVNVECPTAASAGATACYGGHCTDPRCNPTDPTTFEFCADLAFCHEDSECPTPAACSTRHCVEGECTADPYVPATPADACAATEWCDPTGGCDPLPTDGPQSDAGTSDAEVIGDAGLPVADGSTSDASGDANEPCYQTICENPAFPCFYSYIDCASPTRACTPFVRRETGSVCTGSGGPGSGICSSDVECIDCPGAPFCDPTSDVDGDGVPDRLDVETCDGLDDDGDGAVDEGLPLSATPTFADADGDMHGAGAGARRCIGLLGYVASSDDCDDTRGDVSPDALEVCNDRDDDCDTLVDGADGSISGPFGGGDGSVATPFRICTRAHFDAVGTALGAHFIQTADLDLSAAPIAPIGAASTAIDTDGGGFGGEYDGGGHTLTTVRFSETGTRAGGLFRKLDSTASVHDLTLRGVSMDGGDVVGTIAGTSFGAVARVHVIGGGISSHATAGGLVGHLRAPGTIVGSTVEELTVRSFADSARVGTVVDTGVGGAVGVMYGGTASGTTLTNVTVSWSATGTSIASWTFAGGFVGYMSSATVTGSRVSGAIDAVLNVGGFVGACEGAGLLTDDVADVDTTGQTTVGGFASTDKCTTQRSGARGDVTATRGGAAGFVFNLECQPAIVFEELFATGDVVATGGDAGGFANLVRTRAGVDGSVRDIVALGSVTSNTGIAGGLVGVRTGCTLERGVVASPTVRGATAFGSYIGRDATTLGGTGYVRGALVMPEEGVGGLDYAAVLPRTDAELVDATTMPALDFAAVWAISATRTDGRALGPVLAFECDTDGITCR